MGPCDLALLQQNTFIKSVATLARNPGQRKVIGGCWQIRQDSNEDENFSNELSHLVLPHACSHFILPQLRKSVDFAR
jgi:hypothetical protein